LMDPARRTLDAEARLPLLHRLQRVLQLEQLPGRGEGGEGEGVARLCHFFCALLKEGTLLVAKEGLAASASRLPRADVQRTEGAAAGVGGRRVRWWCF
jgi:hypothetical protein